MTDDYDSVTDGHDVPDGYDAVVYDLDGTLVRLAVDWSRAAADVAAVYRDAGVQVGDGDVWRLVDDAPRHGIAEAVEAALADHEVGGVPESRRLPLADEVAGLDVPVGVCSLNCEAAVRAALERHDLDDHVDAVVGRDTVEGMKPDPGPLEAAIDRLGAEPERTLFVGDSDTDQLAADAAGAAFQWVRDRVDDA